MRQHPPARARALLFAAFGLLLCLEGPAVAQDYEAAGRSFAAAQDAFARGEYKKAAESFRAAHDITKDPVLLFNIGESWQRAGDAPRAVASYRAYLQAQPQAADRPEVEKRLRELEDAAPSPGATPGTPPGATPGAAPAQATPAAPTTPPEERRQVAAASPYRTAAWASMAGAMAIVTAGAVLGLGAQNRADELSRRVSLVMSGQPLEYNEAERNAYESLMSEGRAYNQAAIACLVVAGAAAVTSGVLFLIDWRRGRGPEAKQKTSQKASASALVPSLRSSPIGAGRARVTALPLSWSF